MNIIHSFLSESIIDNERFKLIETNYNTYHIINKLTNTQMIVNLHCMELNEHNRTVRFIAENKQCTVFFSYKHRKSIIENILE